MGLRDITGVFSRFFIVGFFVPSFFVALTFGWLFSDVDERKPIVVVGGAALLAALVVVGLRDWIWKLFERIPGKFRTATTHYHTRVRQNWHGLEVEPAWPFVQPFFNQQERELDIDGRSDVHFFLNCCVGAVVVACFLVANAIEEGEAGWLALAAAALVASAFAYFGAAGAVRPWGEFKEAAVALHRLELYKQLGFSAPEDDRAERDVVTVLNARISEPKRDPGRLVRRVDALRDRLRARAERRRAAYLARRQAWGRRGR